MGVLGMEWRGHSTGLQLLLEKRCWADRGCMGASTKRMYTGGCIIQIGSVDTFTVQIVEDLGQLDVGLGVAARHQKAYSWYLGVGVSRERLVGKKEAGLEPRLLLCLRWRRWWGGVGGVSVRGRRLGGWELGIGGGREAVRLSVYDSLSFGWNVAIGEQDSGLGRVRGIQCMRPCTKRVYQSSYKSQRQTSE